MSASPSPVDKPPAYLSLMIGEEERKFFMSFGLLNEVASLVGGPEAVPGLSFDTSRSYACLELVLAKRDKRGNIVRPEDDVIVPVDLEPEVAEKILEWASAHVLDFFVRRFARSAVLFATRAGELAAVGSSLTSSENLAGKTA